MVVHGQTPIQDDVDGKDPFEAARKLGIFEEIDSECTITTADIVSRIIKNRYKHFSLALLFFQNLQTCCTLCTIHNVVVDLISQIKIFQCEYLLTVCKM